jgi:hypothetical protein
MCVLQALGGVPGGILRRDAQRLYEPQTVKALLGRSCRGGNGNVGLSSLRKATHDMTCFTQAASKLVS